MHIQLRKKNVYSNKYSKLNTIVGNPFGITSLSFPNCSFSNKRCLKRSHGKNRNKQSNCKMFTNSFFKMTTLENKHLKSIWEVFRWHPNINVKNISTQEHFTSQEKAKDEHSNKQLIHVLAIWYKISLKYVVGDLEICEGYDQI